MSAAVYPGGGGIAPVGDVAIGDGTMSEAEYPGGVGI